jgi:hypothetical protein
MDELGCVRLADRGLPATDDTISRVPAAVELRDAIERFGAIVAIDRVNLVIETGEIGSLR